MNHSKQKQLPFILTIFSFMVMLFIPLTVHSADVTLAWNKPDDSRVTGYKVYCGKSGTDFQSTPIQTLNSADQLSCPITDLEEGQTYSITATSFDINDNESEFSEAINYFVVSPNDVDDDGDGYTETQGDCNDNDAAIHPDAVEICGDGIDQDCNGSDLACTPDPENVDDDGDGYTENQGDCNDSDPSIHPGAMEICGDGIDQDCNGSDLICPEDIDNDGDSYTENQGDCNDSDASIHPGAAEICGDEIDQDCDGIDLECLPDPADIDDDGDGYTENEGDCNDSDTLIYPGAIEICGDGIDQDCDGSDLECIPEELVIENGEIKVNHYWTFVSLINSFNDAVVIAKPMSLNGSDPAVIRVRNVSSEGFEIRVQEWDYLGGGHDLETVGYIVMESGSHMLPDGTMIEAGIFETNGPKSISLTFAGKFSEAPVVLAGVTSFNDAEAVTGRIYNVTSNGFDFELDEQEANKDGHLSETISYIAWEPSIGEIDGMIFEVGRTKDEITHNFSYIPFSQPFMSAPVFIADAQTKDGKDTANVRWQAKDAYGVEVVIDEEQSKDVEINHKTEVVGYLVIE